MDNDADVETYVARLRSADSAARALAADEATDGVSDRGRHSYTVPQAERITRALVDALLVESDDSARESIVNALAAFVGWDLAPAGEVARALAVPRPSRDPAAAYWVRALPGSTYSDARRDGRRAALTRSSRT